MLIIVSNFQIDDVTMKLMLLTYSLPPLFTLLGFSSLLFGYIVAHWHGDPNTHLLLRLIDEHHTNAA